MCDSKAFYSTAYFVLRIILICLFCWIICSKPPVALSAEGQKDEQEHVSDVNMSEPRRYSVTPSEGQKTVISHCQLVHKR